MDFVLSGGDSYAGSDIQVIIIDILDLKHVRWGRNNNMHTSNSTNGYWTGGGTFLAYAVHIRNYNANCSVFGTCEKYTYRYFYVLSK